MKWQPIDSAPKDGSWFWAFYPKDTAECFPDQWKPAKWVGQNNYGDWVGFMDAADHEEFNQPTHWMPLPPPPGGPDEEPALAGDTVGAADAVASLTQKIEAQSAIISEKNDLIDKLEAERETLITELERLLEQLGRKDLSI